jgi:dimethylaniline monooxygenase (N-oxide forming)
MIKQTAVELDNGQSLDIDTIIICTGYMNNFSILGQYDPTRDTVESWGKLRGSNGRPLARLYQGLFSLDFPESLVSIETILYTLSATLNADISSMVVAQVWAGRSRLPSKQVMTRAVQDNEKRIMKLATADDIYPYNINGEVWGAWADRMAGTGVYERITGHGWKAWWFWLTDHAMYSMIMDGAFSPYIFRLFDEGKRKAWPGARAAIIRANEIKEDRGA